MNIQNLKLIALLLFAPMVLISCKKDHDDPDDPHDHNDEELITTVNLTLTDADGGIVTAQWQDKDGDGGEAPTIETIGLNANTTYTVSIEFLDESHDPAEDITEEIAEEDEEHLICFATQTGVTIDRTDSDGNYEVGLKSEWITSGAESGEVTIRLLHQPDVKDGTCDVGETDVEVTFPLVIN